MMRRALVLALLAAPSVADPQVWTGYDVSFVREDFVDWTLPENQDRITDLVWITRGASRGIFNIAQEMSYQGQGTTGMSPVGTRWARGHAADYNTLTFTTWAVLANNNPPSLVGQDLCVYLIDDDIYLDLRFTHWSVGAGAGGFSYVRAGPSSCLVDISGSSDPNDPAYGIPDGVVDASDFFYFLDQFAAMNLAVADLSGSSDPNHADYGVPDGVLDASDFFYFLDLFVLGCP